MRYILLISTLLVASSAQAYAPHWTNGTRRAMAQCLLAETDWGRTTEQAAVAHVLMKRWMIVAALFDTTLERVIRKYCSIHHHIRNSTTRQRLVRRLPWGPLRRDPGFPPGVDWKLYVQAWDEIRELVKRVEHKVLPDPIPEAWHFGSVEDHKKRYAMLWHAGFARYQGPLAPPWKGSTEELENYFYRRR